MHLLVLAHLLGRPEGRPLTGGRLGALVSYVADVAPVVQEPPISLLTVLPMTYLPT